MTVRLFAAAREAVGESALQVDPGSVREICDAVVASADPQRASRVAAVLAMSALLCDGVRYRATDTAQLTDGSVLDVLPPFAGG